ncbi:DUF456 domain-containing protein [Metabacillus malikii]|uniref:Uncharacterized protein YqgC (DUF456 family) n=1 Tax=Metabacillus malikii TaxID=1504265 RepID=A0ABT9ZI24_9BACI|nr:DUF456 family protein [Metabacillus malikii]MDQ0231630.1 uncharacterized protein YqgC (DUF456 family) [Metabacillus malikii]
MDILYWSIIIIMFLVAFIGLIYPIIPSVVFIILGFVLYGFLFNFSDLTLLFWIVELVLAIILFVADYFTNMIGIKKYGGSKAAVWGSTIGLLIGPFIIPLLGIVIGPFIGAIIAELIVHKKGFIESIKVGIGSLIGFISGVFAKGLVQLIMVGFFIFTIV